MRLAFVVPLVLALTTFACGPAVAPEPTPDAGDTAASPLAACYAEAGCSEHDPCIFLPDGGPNDAGLPSPTCWTCPPDYDGHCNITR